MARSTKETKAEIKAMRVGGKGDDSLLTASWELDAVVMATEEATNTILNALGNHRSAVDKDTIEHRQRRPPPGDGRYPGANHQNAGGL